MPASTLTPPSQGHSDCSCHPESTPARHISRRSVLKGGGALATVAVAVPGFGTAAFASNDANRTGDIVVNIFLRGGMDGLSVVAPRNDRDGRQLSGGCTTRHQRRSLITAPAEHRLRSHPAMAALMPTWDSGRLALIPAAGFTQGNRSHFTVQRQMDFGANLGTAASPAGWHDTSTSPPPRRPQGCVPPRCHGRKEASTVRRSPSA